MLKTFCFGSFLVLLTGLGVHVILVIVVTVFLVVLFIVNNVLVISRWCALDARSSSRGDSACQSERVVYVAGHNSVPRRIYPKDVYRLMVSTYRGNAILSAGWFDQVWLTNMTRDGYNAVVYYRRERARDTASREFARR